MQAHSCPVRPREAFLLGIGLQPSGDRSPHENIYHTSRSSLTQHRAGLHPQASPGYLYPTPVLPDRERTGRIQVWTPPLFQPDAGLLR